MPQDVQVSVMSGFEYKSDVSGWPVRLECHASSDRLTMIVKYGEGVPDTIAIPVGELDNLVESLQRLQRLRGIDGS